MGEEELVVDGHSQMEEVENHRLMVVDGEQDLECELDVDGELV